MENHNFASLKSSLSRTAHETPIGESNIPIRPESRAFWSFLLRRGLQLINEFLPVNELSGRLIKIPVLKQFGLVDNETIDRRLTVAFGWCLISNAAPEKRSKSRENKSRELNELGCII